jgi:hypothetical protein
MARLEYFNPRRPRARVLAGLIARAGSYLPPPALRRLVLPFVRVSHRGRPRELARRTERLVLLLVGDGRSLRVRRQSERRAR